MAIFINRIREQFKPQEPSYVQELVNECEVEDNDYLKNVSSNRSYTDVPFLVLHGVLLIILAFLLGYCIINGDIDRLTKGYDDCGNVCGKKNDFQVKFHLLCKAEDMTEKPFLYINGKHRDCVASCHEENILIKHRCFSKENQTPGDETHQIDAYIRRFFKSTYECLHQIIFLTVFALVFTFVVLLMLRYFTAVFIWFVLFGMLLIWAGLTVFFGNIAATTDSTNVQGNAISVTILYGVFTVIMIAVIVVVKKRMQVIVQLFKEAGKAVMTMPMLLFEPLLTFACVIIICSAWLYFTLWVESAGTPTELYEKVTFEPTGLTYCIDLYNFFIMLWMVQFVCGCQNMLIAGAVSTWYFARNKSKLGKPIYNSGYNMIKYHLGTISLTSLIIAVIQFVRILIQMVRRFMRFPCVTFCLNYVDQWVKYFTRNSCIITAIHGYGFRQAGSRAFNLIVENVMQLVAISSVGDLVLIVSKLLVAASTTIISTLILTQRHDVEMQWAVNILIGFMSYMIAHCFFSVYEVAINTIFICFCEDREINDGVTRPYFMSHELMEFVEKSKAILILLETKKNTAKPAPAVSA